VCFQTLSWYSRLQKLILYCHDLCVCATVDGVLDWILDLLTTYTHHSELQVIRAISLTSTLYTLSPLQPAISSIAVPWQRLLTVEILQLHVLRFYLHSLPRRTLCELTVNWATAPSLLGLPCRTQLSTDWVAPIVFLITPLHGSSREHRFQE
jgi:hypothetical protein